MAQVPKVRVGIMNEPMVEFVLNNYYVVNGEKVTGNQLVQCVNGMVQWNGKMYSDLLFEPINADSDSFTLENVTIGVSFHWKRKEDQTFRGALHLIVENDRITTINILSVEEYLLSVISSEMSATASLELLKAHAVISRSWLLAQINKDNDAAVDHDPGLHQEFAASNDDDITRASTETVRQAIEATWGQVLMYGGELCDARFSKSCGGVYEQFENCWQDQHHPYLVARRDDDDEMNFPDLTREDNAADWILSSPHAHCNTTDKEILSQVLNDYDQETTDFYRWRVEYTQDELSKLIKERTGDDYGRIIDLEPVARGTSGRLYKMRIVGEKMTKVIGKELSIRYALSPSCLYSSAFIVEVINENGNEFPEKFVLRGAGWGHGVGLCQIGAAVMGAKGYNYQQILLHYFIDAQIKTIY